MREWLKDMRLNQHMTQAEVARQVNISQPSYWAIEQGKRNPSRTNAKKIAAVLGFDWTKFYE